MEKTKSRIRCQLWNFAFTPRRPLPLSLPNTFSTITIWGWILRCGGSRRIPLFRVRTQRTAWKSSGFARPHFYYVKPRRINVLIDCWMKGKLIICFTLRPHTSFTIKVPQQQRQQPQLWLPHLATWTISKSFIHSTTSFLFLKINFCHF